MAAKPTNAYALLLGLSGMSIAEAAVFHEVRPDTTTSWSSGRRTAPPGALAELRGLIADQEAASSRHLSLIRKGRAVSPPGSRGTYLMSAPADDAAARRHGMPCVGAWRAMAGRVLAATEEDVELGRVPDNSS